MQNMTEGDRRTLYDEDARPLIDAFMALEQDFHRAQDAAQGRGDPNGALHLGASRIALLEAFEKFLSPPWTK